MEERLEASVNRYNTSWLLEDLVYIDKKVKDGLLGIEGDRRSSTWE